MLRIANHFLERSAGEVFQTRRRFGVAQQSLRSEDDEWLANATAIFAAVHLTPQQMEVLRGRGAVANLNIIFGAKLEKALNACAGVLGALAFKAMRQQQHKPAGLVPFRFGRNDELVNDDLRAVDKIAELRLPYDERQRVGHAIAELKTHHRIFAEQA